MCGGLRELGVAGGCGFAHSMRFGCSAAPQLVCWMRLHPVPFGHRVLMVVTPVARACCGSEA